MEEIKDEAPNGVDENVEIPVEVREAAAQLIAGGEYGSNELRKDKYKVLRGIVGEWIKERRKQTSMKAACWEVGLNPVSVHMWQSTFDIDVGSAKVGTRDARRQNPGRLPQKNRVYLEEFKIPEPTVQLAPAEEVVSSEGHFSLQVIKMEGDGKTVQSAMEALREFLKPKE